MGYELNRLMQQYGVATPSLAAPPPSLAEGATEEQKAAQAADMAAYNKYRDEYMTRLKSVPMYGQRQYNTGLPGQYMGPVLQPATSPQYNPPNTVAELYQKYLGRKPDEAGLNYWNQQIAQGAPFADVYQAIKTSPEAQTATIPYAQGYQNLQKTGSFYNNTLRSPVYTYTPPPPKPPAPTPDQYAELQKQIEELKAQQQSYSYNPYYNSYGGGNGNDGTGGDSGGHSMGDSDAGGIGDSSSPGNAGSFAHGGLAQVKKYSNGGEVELPEEVALPLPETPLTAATKPVAMTEPAAVQPAAINREPAAPEPAAPDLDRTVRLQQMLNQYGPQSGGYGEELAAARQRAQAETAAFTELLNRQLESPESDKASKAEMYFRLAAAFGSPTQTGSFAENLGNVGRELAGYSQGRRESAGKKRDLMLAAQQLKMGTAKEDLATVRALEAESMKDRREIAKTMMQEYIASGKPQSTAGKMAVDMGLKPGTPEYKKAVEEYAALDMQNKMGEINAQLVALTAANENIKLKQELAGRLSPTEMKMRVESEDLIASGSQALKDLEEAYRLNPNTFAGGWVDTAQRTLLEAAGSNDPKVVNTRVLENLLGSQGLSKLRATFGGNPTEGERAILMELEGIGSRTKEERGRIIRRAYQVLQDRVAREQRRLDNILSGAYRTTQPLPEQGAE